MTKDIRSRAILLSGGLAVGIAVVFGTFYAFSRGGNDFSVFYEAWHLVLSGRGAEIYKVSPDRFLYGPGFAWALAPLAGLPKNVALAIWCAAKILVVGSVARQLSVRLSGSSKLGGERAPNSGDAELALGLSLWGIAWVARPMIIDFTYGQVNLFILGACVWALLGHFDSERSPFKDIVSWSLLTWVALSKLFPIPLLITPWLVTQGIKQVKLKNEKLGIFFGILVVLVPPLVSLGWLGSWELLLGWRDALISRGLPLESHNQSFIALLYHYLSGNPTQILSEGPTPLLLGWASLSVTQIGLLSLFWTTLTLGVVLGWIFSGSKHESLKWSVVSIGFLIIPSHLVWKPYFVMSIPLAVLFIHQVYEKGNWISYLLAAGIFVGVNLTGFDFVGHQWAAHLEAGSILLIMHLVLISLIASNWCSLVNVRNQEG